MFFFTGQTIEGVDLGALRHGEHNGDHATLTVRFVFNDDDGEGNVVQMCDATDDAYGHEHTYITHADIKRALA